MKIVIFGLTVSSSWGNSHATLWRGLCQGLRKRGHFVSFFERDVPYYAAQRDLYDLPGGKLHLYSSWDDVHQTARIALADADVGMVTSYCADGVAAAELVVSSPAHVSVFYDMDTPVTLEKLSAGRSVAYLPPDGLGDFDLVLSYTEERALEELKTRLGARRVFLLLQVDRPELFDAVVADDDGAVRHIQVKQQGARSNWVWGAFKMPGAVLHDLRALWMTRQPPDEYFGTLVNAYLERGGHAIGVRAGKAYVYVGTLHGYREVINLLGARPDYDGSVFAAGQPGDRL